MKKDFEMSPLYGYEIHSSHDEHREFVEVIFTDSPHSEKEAEIEIKDTALDNPCYESYNDLSDGHKVGASYVSVFINQIYTRLVLHTFLCESSLKKQRFTMKLHRVHFESMCATYIYGFHRAWQCIFRPK